MWCSKYFYTNWNDYPWRRNVTTSEVRLKTATCTKSHPKLWTPEIELGNVEEKEKKKRWIKHVCRGFRTRTVHLYYITCLRFTILVRNPRIVCSMPCAAPEDVAAPNAVATPTTLRVFWDSPARPNGNITGYFLYRDGGQIYAGGERQYLVAQLRVSIMLSYHFLYYFRSAQCSWNMLMTWEISKKQT